MASFVAKGSVAFKQSELVSSTASLQRQNVTVTQQRVTVVSPVASTFHEL